MYQTEHLVLRVVQDGDVEKLAEILQDYTTSVGISSTDSHMAPPTLGDVKKTVQNGGSSFTVTYEGRIIGYADLSTNWIAHNCRPLLFLDKDHRGKGYGREIMRFLIEFAFKEINARKVALTVYSFNESAIKLYRSLGFIEEGRHREEVYRNGQYWDVISMGLFRRDWNYKRVEKYPDELKTTAIETSTTDPCKDCHGCTGILSGEPSLCELAKVKKGALNK